MPLEIEQIKDLMADFMSDISDLEDTARSAHNQMECWCVWDESADERQEMLSALRNFGQNTSGPPTFASLTDRAATLAGYIEDLPSVEDEDDSTDPMNDAEDLARDDADRMAAKGEFDDRDD